MAADLGGDAGQQFLPVDRPDQIVVDAHVEGAQQALVVVRIDDDEDRRLPRRLDRFQLRADAQPVDPFHVEVDDDEFEAALRRAEGLDGLLRVVDQRHLMLARQRGCGCARPARRGCR